MRRSRRLALMVSLALAWAIAIAGVATRTSWAASAGLLLAGVLSLVLAKLLIETTVALTKLAAATPKVAPPVRDSGVAAVAVDAQAAVRDVGVLRKRVGELELRVDGVDEHDQMATERVASVESAISAVELAVADSRRLLDKVARRIVQERRPADIDDLGRTGLENPTLSIAIPVFNRSGVFAECLASIEENLADVPAGSVEVCITDDASSDPDTVDIAADFVRRVRGASLHLNPVNLGLEGNLLRSSSHCRGSYVLVLGSDDRLMRGALRVILADLQDGRAGVCVYDQSRITLAGLPAPRVDGSAPIDIPAGGTHEFSSLIDGIRRRGLISTIGFTSTVVFRRAEFEAIDPAPYLGLTVYPMAFIIAQAHASTPLRYTNVAAVEHRTPQGFEKHAEGIGTSEADFMRGGSARAARHFGTTLAASFQRLIDNGALDPATVSDLPERLLTRRPLAEWIAKNRTIAPHIDESLKAAVLVDAARFFETVGSRGSAQLVVNPGT